jgi:diguanylate cyclase (GGDEF)-like protein
MSALVLVADADPFNLHLLSELCGSLGYEVMTAADGGAVLDAMARQRPSLVVMDVRLPVMDGLSVLGILKADRGLCDVPVVLVTQEDDAAHRERGMALGARHCLYKPYRPLEVQQRLREIVDASTDSEPARSPRRANGTQVRELADPITQLGTASQLRISLDYEFTRAIRYRHALSCVVVACSNAEELVSRLGEQASHGVITAISNTIKGGIRTVDHLFRSREFEFTILLPETHPEGVRIVAARLRAVLRGLNTRAGLPTSDVYPRIVLGCSSMPASDLLDGEALYSAARRDCT